MKSYIIKKNVNGNPFKELVLKKNTSVVNSC